MIPQALTVIINDTRITFNLCNDWIIDDLMTNINYRTTAEFCKEKNDNDNRYCFMI